MKRVAGLVLVAAVMAGCGGGSSGDSTDAQKAACSRAASDADSANQLLSTDLSSGGGFPQAARDLGDGAGKVRDDVAGLESSSRIRADAEHMANAMNATAAAITSSGLHYQEPLRQFQVAANDLIRECKPLVPDIH